MSDEFTEIADLQLPYSRRAQLREVEYEGGMTMLRLVLREGRRITQVELDPETAGTLGATLQSWAEGKG